jgi:hypothetical protein
MVRAGVALVLASALGPVAAHADDVFRLDPVFVSVFRVEDPEDEATARAVERRVAARLAERHLVVPVSDVAGFEDYSAEVYLRSCPRELLSGCAYVIGERAGADWAVDGFVEAAPGDGGAVLVETTIVDVRRARSVVTFTVRLDGTNDAAWADAVANLVDRLAAQGDPEDIRDLSAAAAAEREAALRAAEREAVAQSLDTITAGLKGSRTRTDGGAVRPVRVTAAQIAAWQAQEAAPPWERVGLDPRRYRIYRNRGEDLATFRAQMRGRGGALIVRGGLGGGYANGRVSLDARWAIDPATTEVVGLEQRLAVIGGGGPLAALEVGYGLTPWLDVAVGGASRRGQHDWLVHAESIDRPREPRPRSTGAAGEIEGLARVTFAPLPLGRARPLATAAVGAWTGPSMARFVDFASAPALTPPARPVAIRGRLGLGGEVEVADRVQLFARAELVAPFGPAVREEVIVGDPSRITFRDDRDLRGGRGGFVVLGVQGRTAPLVGRADARTRP